MDRVCGWVLGRVESLGALPEVVDFCVGVRYSYVLLRDGGRGWLGVALTPIEDVIGSPYELPERIVCSGLLDYVSSLNPAIKSLGVALLNALSNYLLWGLRYGSGFEVRLGDEIIDLLVKLIEEPVVVIGNMGPLIRRLRSYGFKDVKILERNPCFRCGTALPDVALGRVVPCGGTLVVTGATLVNDTIDYILELGRGRSCRVVLVGPTAAAHPEPLLNEGIYAVASMVPVKNNEVIKVIKLGGGRWSFSKYCKHYIVIGNSALIK